MIALPERDYEVQALGVDPAYFETMKIHLREGRIFDERLESDYQTIIVNQLLTEKLDLEQPIGQVFKINNTNYQIIGIAENFHHNSFYEAIPPAIFKMVRQGEERFLSIRTREGSVNEVYSQEQWSSTLPDEPFAGGYQVDVWVPYFDMINSHAQFLVSYRYDSRTTS